MRKLRLFSIFGLTSLLIMACNLFNSVQFNFAEQSANSNETDLPSQAFTDPGIDSDDSTKSCLAKTWEITGLSDYITAAIPANVAAEYNLQYENSRGHVYFTLTPDGQIILLADHLELIFSTQALVFNVPVIVSIDGTALGSYMADDTNLTITQLDTSGLSATAQAFGEDLVDSQQIISAIPLTQAPYNTAHYTCQGDLLQLDFSNAPGNLPPLIFQAVQ
jgi:hypothetical protein